VTKQNILTFIKSRLPGLIGQPRRSVFSRCTAHRCVTENMMDRRTDRFVTTKSRQSVRLIPATCYIVPAPIRVRTQRGRRDIHDTWQSARSVYCTDENVGNMRYKQEICDIQICPVSDWVTHQMTRETPWPQATVIIMSSVCPSVCLWQSVLWLIIYQQVNIKYPLGRNTILQLSTPWGW